MCFCLDIQTGSSLKVMFPAPGLRMEVKGLGSHHSRLSTAGLACVLPIRDPILVLLIE